MGVAQASAWRECFQVDQSDHIWEQIRPYSKGVHNESQDTISSGARLKRPQSLYLVYLKKRGKSSDKCHFLSGHMAYCGGCSTRVGFGFSYDQLRSSARSVSDRFPFLLPFIASAPFLATILLAIMSANTLSGRVLGWAACHSIAC